MPRRFCLVLALLLLAPAARPQSPYPSHPDYLIPLAPFKIADNLYYVGGKDLASYLIVTPAGDILINSSVVESPAMIAKSMEQLGFHMSDVKILLISHSHIDHDAGSAEIIRRNHAKYMVMDGDVPVVESGGKKDFAYSNEPYPPSHVDRILHDGDHVTLGGVTLIAHKTPGHTRGCTTWTMRAVSGGKPRNVVIVGSWNVNPGYRLVASPGHPAFYPTIVADYRRTFAVLHSLPCDIFLGAHGGYFNMLAKLKKADAIAKSGGDPQSVWIDPEGYKAAVAEREHAFLTELKRQQDAVKAGKAI